MCVLHLTSGDYSDYFRAKKAVLGTVEPLKLEDITKLEVDGEEYDGIPMKREDVFAFWKPVVILCSLSDTSWLRSEIDSLTDDNSWYQRLGRVIYDVLVPLLNTVALDRGRTKSLLLKVPLLVCRHLMSVPTFESGSYVAHDNVVRVPEHFPVNHRSLGDWSRFIANNPVLTTILDLPKPNSVTDATQTTSEERAEVSDDDSEDEQMEEEVRLEMLESVPGSIVDSAIQYEASTNEIHRQQIIDDVSEYVCLLDVFFLIVGPYG